MYKFYRVTLRGQSPLIVHNGQLADPLNPFAKALKAANAKRKKTDADHAAIADIEWKGGLYVDADGRPIVPSRVLEAVIAKGAMRSKEGKSALSGMFVETDGVLRFRGDGRSIDEMQADPNFRITVGVRVGQSRVMRTRPIFHDWSLTFDVSVSTDVVTDAAQLRRWIESAGEYVGIGDWRPRYGRYLVSEFVELQQDVRAAA
jgi:hypothetical protein